MAGAWSRLARRLDRIGRGLRIELRFHAATLVLAQEGLVLLPLALQIG